ncbi:MAG: Ribosomal RNA small subunit methyltransferase E [Candidatus Anoxychlamydiales bacterium]|nr:Ribosomal RNA small subunit methyltransferase E [Candidatus Anoxychlamydiales bacterium]
MPIKRFYQKDLKKDDLTIEIQGSEFHHLKNVMRVKEKEEVDIINGKGLIAKAKLTKIHKSYSTFNILSKTFQKEKDYKTILVQAIIQPLKLDFLLEKCTELDVDEFYFFCSKNSEKINFSKNRLERMNNILISSIKQCSKLYLPKINILKSLYEISFDGTIYYGSTKKAPLLKNSIKKSKKSYFVIGPSMGFDSKEIEFLSNINALSVSLSDNILRSETASIASICLLNHLIK